MIDRQPHVVTLTVDLHKHLVEVPLPLPETLHPAHALTPNIGSKQRAETVPPQPHGFMANVDPALEQQVLDVAQAQRKPDVHHDDQTDHLGRRGEIPEWAGCLRGLGMFVWFDRTYCDNRSV